MNKKTIIFIFLALILVFSFFLFEYQQPIAENTSSVTFFENQNNEGTLDFEKAIDLREFNFPEDHGAHPEFLTEWWYYTGNLFTEEGRHFGYQLTFFRRAISDQQSSDRLSNWASDQVYFAHFAVTDTSRNEHYVFDEIARGSANLAGTSIDPLFSIWLKDWEINQISENQFSMVAEVDDLKIDFILTDLKGIIFHGNSGLSQKGEEIGNASYYFSQTRLETVGIVQILEEEFAVQGYSWMDHEFGTSTLGSDQIGWDWFSIQLDDNSEIMMFQIRDENGGISPFSSGTIIGPGGFTKNLQSSDFTIEVLETWENSDGIVYPSKWRIISEENNINLEVKPLIKDQEIDLFFRYWEGAVRVSGMNDGVPVAGYGYVELTGYAQSMQGVF